MENIDVKQNIAKALKDTTMLADVSIRMWSGSATDEAATEQVRSANNVTAVDAGKFHKKLLADHDSSLRKVTSALNKARNHHYRLTAPFTPANQGKRTGPRLLAKIEFEKYMVAMAEHKAIIQKAVDEFIDDYPRARDEAIKSLGGIGNTSEYPSQDEMRRKFGFDFHFEPVPVGSDFTNLPERTLNALSRRTNNLLQEKYEQAMQDVWSRTLKSVERMVERLTGVDEKTGKPKTFSHTMISNVKEAVVLLESLDVEANSERQEVVRRIKESLVVSSADELRKDETKRQSVRANAEKILENMQGLV